jgi:hydroxyacylglutathione hydrolase
MGMISEGVYFVPGQDEFIPDANTYFVGNASSRDFSLVDPGLTGKGRYKIESLRNMGIELSFIRRIILTHTHIDHMGCLSEIQRQIPSAELWVHSLEAMALEEGDERVVYGDMSRSMCQTRYGLSPGAFHVQVDRKLQGGETFNLGGMKWEVIHVPGHSAGSIALYERSKKILISGDVVYADYAVGRVDLHGADVCELRKSLMRLADLEVEILLPGHTRIVESLPSDYIRKTAEQWNSKQG